MGSSGKSSKSRKSRKSGKSGESRKSAKSPGRGVANSTSSIGSKKSKKDRKKSPAKSISRFSDGPAPKPEQNPKKSFNDKDESKSIENKTKTLAEIPEETSPKAGSKPPPISIKTTTQKSIPEPLTTVKPESPTNENPRVTFNHSKIESTDAKNELLSAGQESAEKHIYYVMTVPQRTTSNNAPSVLHRLIDIESNPHRGNNFFTKTSVKSWRGRNSSLSNAKSYSTVERFHNRSHASATLDPQPPKPSDRFVHNVKMSKLGQGRKKKLAAAAKIDLEKSAWVMPNLSFRNKSIEKATVVPVPDRASSTKSTKSRSFTKKLLHRKDIYSKTMQAQTNPPNASPSHSALPEPKTVKNFFPKQKIIFRATNLCLRILEGLGGIGLVIP